MPIPHRTIALFALAIALGACRDDMQPDGVIESTATPQAASPRTDAAAPGTANPTNPADAATDHPATDRAFARTALASGLAEVQVSRHVEKQSPTADVRALAKRIADDHGTLNEKLRSFAGSEAVDIDASSKAMGTLIRSSEGTDLDRAYLQHMAEGHARSIARYETAEGSVSDEALRALVKEALPKLREHARAVDTQLSRSK
jgi:putative membrane protein